MCIIAIDYGRNVGRIDTSDDVAVFCRSAEDTKAEGKSDCGGGNSCF